MSSPKTAEATGYRYLSLVKFVPGLSTQIIEAALITLWLHLEGVHCADIIFIIFVQKLKKLKQ